MSEPPDVLILINPIRYFRICFNAPWLPHDHLWATAKGITSLNHCFRIVLISNQRLLGASQRGCVLKLAERPVGFETELFG